MGNFDPAFVHTLAVQSWTLYSIGMFMIVLRMYARIHRLGFKGLEIDDYLMLLAGAFYTMLVVCLNAISSGGGSNLYPPEEYPTFTPTDITERVHGSKIVVASEQAMLNVIYTIKACVLLMYSRTFGHDIQKPIFYLSIYVFLGWLATESAFFTACRPFVGYWALPPPDSQCTTLQKYAIVQGCFNITSDLLMLAIPIPVIHKLQMARKRKIGLMIIFSMGSFVIVAALLTKVFNLMDVWDPSYMLWYTRESSVAIYVANLPMIWPFLREWFPVLGQRLSSKNTKGFAYGKENTKIRGARNVRDSFQGKRKGERGIVTTIRGTGDSVLRLNDEDETEMDTVTRQQSWERNHESDIGLAERGMRSGIWERTINVKDGIQIQTTVEVIEDFIEEAEQGNFAKDLEKGKSGIQWNFRQDERK